MSYPTVLRSLVPTAAAAILGNVLVRRDDLAWFGSLRAPRMQLPLRGFLVVGASYYLSIGTVVHRSIVTGDRTAYRLSLVVLAGNEVWNYLFFGRRSTRAGFLGVLAYAVPVCLLQAALIRDRHSALAFAPYTAWLIGYDMPWTYRLWQLNP
ncbi:MAG TPA: tryptophan-rich sensory protein [Propionibacteriaceae bacterium]|jgi:tryptophan-rich sensory protein